MQDRLYQPGPYGRANQGYLERAERGRGEYLDRHPPDRRQGCTFQGSGLAYHRRGAEVRGIRQGEASAAEGERGHLDNDGHPDPPYPTVLLDVGPGSFQHHHATAQPLSRADGGGAFQPRYHPGSDQFRDEPERAGILHQQPYPEHLRDGSLGTAGSPRRTGSRGARADGTGEARKDHPRFREL